MEVPPWVGRGVGGFLVMFFSFIPFVGFDESITICICGPVLLLYHVIQDHTMSDGVNYNTTMFVSGAAAHTYEVHLVLHFYDSPQAQGNEQHSNSTNISNQKR